MNIYIKRIGNKGELVIPKKIRKQNELKANSKIEIISIKNGILLIPMKEKFSDLAGLFGNRGIRNPKELDAITHELLGGI